MCVDIWLSVSTGSHTCGSESLNLPFLATDDCPQLLQLSILCLDLNIINTNMQIIIISLFLEEASKCSPLSQYPLIKYRIAPCIWKRW